MTQPQDRHSDNLDALHAMANGQTNEPADDAAREDEHAEVVDDAAPAEADDVEVVDDHAALASAAPAAPADPQARAARAAALAAQAQRQHAQQFKKTMIPMLIAVGGLLLLFSLIVLGYLAKGDLDPNGNMRKFGPLMVLVSLPFGAIMILGSWLLHKDVATSERAAQQRQQQLYGNGQYGNGQYRR